MSEGLMYFRNKFCFNEYVTKKYNKRVSTYAIDEKIKDIFIEFKIYPNLGDITDYCPIRDVWFDDEKKKLRVFCKRQQKLV